jgi:UDP-glucose 4-epimerase
MVILVTGGSGYIGSHTCLELLNAGHDVVVLDNLSNSKEESLKRVQQITGKSIIFIKGDIRDRSIYDTIFAEHNINACIHFAGLKAVGESVEKPLEYYENNINGTLVLCDALRSYSVKKLVFSSSATVYGDPHTVPITEDFPLHTTNPYGSSKLMIEQILTDLHHADPSWDITLLRYFNPVGAHESGMIGEDPNGIPNNLMPFITQVAVGKRPKLHVFGNDYPTPDGTGVRDYIHVVDLALGHVRALDGMTQYPGLNVYNLGRGEGYSVLQMVHAFQQATGKTIPYEITARRPGDIATCYADASKAARELNWTATRDIEAMCRDSWRWQSQNPEGYE